MTARAAQHYGYREAGGHIPCFEVTVNRFGKTLVVKRTYGVTYAHALKRALRWMHQHGDPR